SRGSGRWSTGRRLARGWSGERWPPSRPAGRRRCRFSSGLVTEPPAWKLRSRSLTLDRPLLVGVVNVTPDSFSDGGLFVDTQRAIAHARSIIADGADIIAVGGESTRPGADADEAAAQLR